MTVTPPETYGNLKAWSRVWGCAMPIRRLWKALGYAGNSGAGMAWSVKADAAGQYQVWGDATAGPLTVTVSAPAHLQSVFAGVILTATQTITQDFIYALSYLA